MLRFQPSVKTFQRVNSLEPHIDPLYANLLASNLIDGAMRLRNEDVCKLRVLRPEKFVRWQV